MPSSCRNKPKRKVFRIGLVLYPGCMPAGLFAAADLVRACNERLGRERVAVVWVGTNRSRSSVSPTMVSSTALVEARCDAWLVPGLWMASGAELPAVLEQHRRVIGELRALPRSTKVWAYCAGVALVAAAGRLERRAATATWWLHAALSERFARVEWRAGLPLCIDREVVTAPGASGHLPLLLDRLATLYPTRVLRDAQEVLMLPLPRERHAAFASVELMSLSDPELRLLVSFVQRTPAHEVDLALAAKQLGMSVRTMCRRIRATTGLAAGDWLRRIKLHQAAEALRESRAPLKSICDELGFGSEASLHRAFKAVTGDTPGAYRASGVVR